MADDPDPQVQVILDMLDEQNTPPTYGVTPAVAREQYEQLVGMVETQDVEEIQEFDIQGPGGPIPVRTYRPAGGGPFPILVFYHGGGHVIGSLDTHDNVCAALCNGAEALVVSVDYRLAPEHPFPAALEDAFAALEWAATHGAEIGGDPARLAVGGDSAGGNLAAGVALLARDRDGPTLRHQLLVYPVLDYPDHGSFESREANAEGYFLERESIQWFRERYIQDPVHAGNVYLGPLRAADLGGLPGATVVTAGFDPLRDEGAAYADRLAAAGVDVHHENYEGMIHGFVQLTGLVDQAGAALEMMAGDLRDAFD